MGCRKAPLGVGANCGVGASDILASLLDMTEAKPEATVIVKGNCGIPEFRGTEIHYSGTPELMADYVSARPSTPARKLSAAAAAPRSSTWPPCARRSTRIPGRIGRRLKTSSSASVRCATRPRTKLRPRRRENAAAVVAADRSTLSSRHWAWKSADFQAFLVTDETCCRPHTFQAKAAAWKKRI
jgi:hypothetical protein